MKIRFLGTGTSQGIPVIGCTCRVCLSLDQKDKRLRCALLMQNGSDHILVDSGPDIRYQLLRSGLHRLDALLLTHEHYDHTGGLDDLRPLIFLRNQPLPVYSQDDVMEVIKLKYDYAFGDQKYPGAPRFDLIEIKAQEEFYIGSTIVKPLQVGHGDLDILGFKFDHRLVYITDANRLVDRTLADMQHIPVLVINALHHNPHHSHFTLDQTLEVISGLSPGVTYIIHMSHHMGLHQEIQSRLPQDVHLAYDELSLDIGH